mmetsp:Transcript_7744/g.28087  ORF Transcript_7744/g.28087 Transcript_7744/m.28087 type:complete len:203 (-) Transcript_7744:843-1451(-)
MRRSPWRLARCGRSRRPLGTPLPRRRGRTRGERSSRATFPCGRRRSCARLPTEWSSRREDREMSFLCCCCCFRFGEVMMTYERMKSRNRPAHCRSASPFLGPVPLSPPALFSFISFCTSLSATSSPRLSRHSGQSVTTFPTTISVGDSSAASSTISVSDPRGANTVLWFAMVPLSTATAAVWGSIPWSMSSRLICGSELRPM